MVVKELDELTYGPSEAERISHLAVLILKHGHRIEVLKNAYESSFELDKPERVGLSQTSAEDYVKEIEKAFGYLIAECDIMLKLTNQKKAVVYANNYIEKKKKGELKVQMAAAVAAGKQFVPDTPLSKLIAMNLKYEENPEILNLIPPPKPKKPKTVSSSVENKKKRSIAETSPSSPYPYIQDGETHTTIHFSDLKKFVLPNPSNKQYPKLYSLREMVLHLVPYRGQGVRNLLTYMKTMGRITFHRNSYERYARIYEKENILPAADTLYLGKGRPNGSLNIEVKESKNAGLDSVGDASAERRAEIAYPTTNTTYAASAVPVDADAHIVSHEDVCTTTTMNNLKSRENPEICHQVTPSKSKTISSRDGNKKARNTKMRSIAEIEPSTIFYPYIQDGETHTTIHVSYYKKFVLPNPSNKQYPKLYSLREMVLHLVPYRGQGVRNLLTYMKAMGRITFHRNSYERYARIYEKENILPAEDTLYLYKGRPNASYNNDVKEGQNARLDSVGDASAEMSQGNQLNYVPRAEIAYPTTNATYAASAVPVDADAHIVSHVQILYPTYWGTFE